MVTQTQQQLIGEALYAKVTGLPYSPRDNLKKMKRDLERTGSFDKEHVFAPGVIVKTVGVEEECLLRVEDSELAREDVRFYALVVVDEAGQCGRLCGYATREMLLAAPKEET